MARRHLRDELDKHHGKGGEGRHRHASRAAQQGAGERVTEVGELCFEHDDCQAVDEPQHHRVRDEADELAEVESAAGDLEEA